MLGDSLTLGGVWGLRLGFDPLSTITIAHGGNRLDQIATGAEWTERLHLRFAHVLAGTNDVLLGANDPVPFVRSYLALVDRLRRHNIRVLVTLIPPTADPEVMRG